MTLPTAQLPNQALEKFGFTLHTVPETSRLVNPNVYTRPRNREVELYLPFDPFRSEFIMQVQGSDHNLALLTLPGKPQVDDLVQKVGELHELADQEGYLRRGEGSSGLLKEQYQTAQLRQATIDGALPTACAGGFLGALSSYPLVVALGIPIGALAGGLVMRHLRARQLTHKDSYQEQLITQYHQAHDQLKELYFSHTLFDAQAIARVIQP